MTFDEARSRVRAVARSSRGAWNGTAEEKERAVATMLLAFEVRIQKLEAKNQGPDLLKPLGDKLGEV